MFQNRTNPEMDWRFGRFVFVWTMNRRVLPSMIGLPSEFGQVLDQVDEGEDEAG